MRTTFRAELDTLIGDLVRTARLARQLMTNSSTALSHADLALAESPVDSAARLVRRTP